MQLDQHRHDSIRRLINAAQRFAEQPPEHCARLHRVPSRVLNCISARLAAADFAGGTPRCHDWRGCCCPAASLSGRHQGQAPRRSRAPSKGVAAAHAFRVAPAPGAQSAGAFPVPLRWSLGRSCRQPCVDGLYARGQFGAAITPSGPTRGRRRRKHCCPGPRCRR